MTHPVSKREHLRSSNPFFSGYLQLSNQFRTYPHFPDIYKWNLVEADDLDVMLAALLAGDEDS
jgi:hypothetical protein